MSRGRVLGVLCGVALVGATTVGLAAPASANPTPTPAPTLSDCQRSFAASGLLAITDFQRSNKAPEAQAVLFNNLVNAETAFFACLSDALA